MKLTGIFLLAAILQVSARGTAQTVTYATRATPLPRVFTDLKEQTGYSFFYDRLDLRDAVPVTVDLRQAPLREALRVILAGEPLDFDIQGNTIVIIRKEKLTRPDTEPAVPLIDIQGHIADASGNPLSGASVLVKGSTKGASTDANGDFQLRGIKSNATLVISFTGYENKEYKVEGKSSLQISLNRQNSPLDEVQVVAYGTTTKRMNTGAVSTVTSEEIEKQPVTNVLSAISGRVAGVFVQTTNGLPGGNISISIRGKGSILAGTDPLYVIDGVPFASSIVDANTVIGSSSINGAVSPFNSLNPADIESITILKDADATAIYGSRGTNGVILITTKKGKAGAARLDANLYEGISRIADYPKLQNREQYLSTRREAFANDGLIPSSDPTSFSYAPDLTVWDTTKSTGWVKYSLGGTGHVTNGQVSVSGGSTNTSFNISGNYRAESTILPGSNLYQRGGMYMNLQHTSINNRFSMLFSSSYTADKNRLVNPINGIATDLFLPPDYPVYDASGNLNWAAGSNPKADQKATSKTSTDNLVGNVSLRYNLLPGLNVKVNVGYNKINVNQTQIFPTASLYPGLINYTNFGLNSNQSYIVEPQLEYNRKFKYARLALLAGSTYQDRITQGQIIVANNFTSVGLMENLSSAGTIYPYNSYARYKYESVFGRVTYNWEEKYILNGTIRRDGSSRFGPGNQFGNFGSIGGAWIFSNEKWIKSNAPFLSFGKLRSSYGLTGNDQISDYQYLSTYSSSSSFNYQDTSALQPSRIANANFHWETTRKLELAIEVGLLHDRILLTVDRYQNRSKDQLVDYTVPNLTGFSYYEANLPAVVENTGWEFELNTKNIQTGSFSWTTTFNITLPKNRLKSFDNFSSSSYSQFLELGYDITRLYGYRSLGVDPATGQTSYAPQPGTMSTDPYFFFRIGKRTPDFYGGLGNTFTYHGLQLDIFCQYAQQKAMGGITYLPGVMINNFALMNDRWEHPGDLSKVPKATTMSQDYYYGSSSSNFFDASYFRVKNVSVSYSFPAKWLKKANLNQLRIYAQGQNLFTMWHRNGALMDPESGALNYISANIPPMKSFAAGIQISF